MVKLKTKLDKHANDNEKRRKSIKEKEKAKLSQSQIIKQALSNATLNNNASKKIIFSDVDDFGDKEFGAGGPTNSKSKNLNENGKSALFDDSESEPENFEIKEKSQFSGKKGFELLNLQSTFGNDERFKIDERFLEKENEECEEDHESAGNGDITDERVKQLKVLESVLGTSVICPEKQKKVKKRTPEMIRYDASNKDHEIYEINNQPETPKLMLSKKRKEGKKTPKAVKIESPHPKVSKEKFYEVSSEIKNQFKEKEKDGGQFSLLQTYGVDGEEDNEKTQEDFESDVADSMDQNDETWSKDMKFENENKTVTEKAEVEKKVTVAKGIWKETFFFGQDDPRFKEGLEFINKKNSEEAKEVADNYNKTRKQLREILRLHLKKQMHKKDPFKNKIGGMNKKQLGSLKSINSRVGFNKKKPPKKNLHGRI